MKFALSTNWNNERLNDGAAIADEAAAIGFDSLELGFRTQPEQLAGFKSRLDVMPVTSVHAYCPVPIGAPSGHPELYQLASSNEDTRALARNLLRKTFHCAADFGAKVVVFHAGYSHGWSRLFEYLDRIMLMSRFKRELDKVLKFADEAHAVLALENLPRSEAFPNAKEAALLMNDYAGAPLKLWFDTGHARVRECNGWDAPATEIAQRFAPHICGIHLNDVRDKNDDHRQPGWGNVDFAALTPLAQGDVLRVFEPHRPVTADELRDSLSMIKKLWSTSNENS